MQICLKKNIHLMKNASFGFHHGFQVAFIYV